MTTAGQAGAAARRELLNPDSLIRGLMYLGRVLRPGDGLLAVFLLGLNLMVVVLSVERAGWVPTPSLPFVLLLAMATGLVLARVPLWGPLVLPAGLGVGLLVVVWQLTSFHEGDATVTHAGELWDRLQLWFDAAREGTINIDQVPFAFGLMAATWILGYLGVWLFSRYRNFWGVFVLGGAGLLSNLTYLPPDASTYLGFYLFTALLVVARVQSVRRRQEWRRRKIRFDEHLGVLSVSDSFFLAAAVLIVAFLVPDGHRLGPANNAYNMLRSPMESWEDDFNRLFAGLPARRALGYRLWGDVMAFQGTIRPTTAVVLRVESPVPMYWKARTYGTYTSKGWVSQDTTFERLDWVPTYSSPQALRARTEVSHSITPSYAAKSLFAGGRVLTADKDVRVETYDSPTYTLELTDPDAFRELPAPLAEAAAGLYRTALQGSVGAEDSALEDSLPPGLRLLEVSRDQGLVREVTLAAVLGERPDVLSVRTAGGRIGAGETYLVNSSLSLATSRELRAAGTDYPASVLIRYTQLPDDMPQRVQDLAAQITAGAGTPYDKAKAIEAYLAPFQYTLNVDPPPFDADGVDHFLFTLKKGYSEYFASGMTVLLRSVGVPARLATGYTVGDKVPDHDIYVVTDSHSHAWVEVFFPRYGWIPFEPTPGAKLPPAHAVGAEEPPADAQGFPGGLPFEDPCLDELEICPDEIDFPAGDGQFPQSAGWKETLRTIWPWLLPVVGLFISFAGAAWFFWRRYMVPSEDPRTAYRRLGLLGALGSAGPVAHQTPFQYQERLCAALPAYSGEVSALVGAYVRTRYGRKQLPGEGRRRLVDAWLRMRFPMLLRVFWRKNQ